MSERLTFELIEHNGGHARVQVRYGDRDDPHRPLNGELMFDSEHWEDVQDLFSDIDGVEVRG